MCLKLFSSQRYTQTSALLIIIVINFTWTFTEHRLCVSRNSLGFKTLPLVLLSVTYDSVFRQKLGDFYSVWLVPSKRSCKQDYYLYTKYTHSFFLIVFTIRAMGLVHEYRQVYKACTHTVQTHTHTSTQSHVH